EFGILDQFPSFVLDGARNLFALTFDFIFVPHTCLLSEFGSSRKDRVTYVDDDFSINLNFISIRLIESLLFSLDRLFLSLVGFSLAFQPIFRGLLFFP